MIAELHGKISSTGSNLSDRLEDKLTGDVFGALRYLPFALGIGPILSAAGSPELAGLAQREDPGVWVDKITFWPRHRLGELDVQIDLNGAVVGIEVKFRSPLSSDDEADYSGAADGEDRTSNNQLARESHIVRELARPDRRAFLLLIAGDSECARIVSDVRRRNLIPEEVTLGSVSWQEILLILEKRRSDDPVYACILREVTALLRRKGFERFSGFDPSGVRICAEDYFSYHHGGSGIQLPGGPQVNGGMYYEFG